MAVGNRKGERPRFLTGWKEIAGYLGKGVRTVQRYEREMGLPVRRPAGKSRAAVVATKMELDAWVTASPCRGEFYLARPLDNSVTKNFTERMAEMKRLHDQMAALRNEIKVSVCLLRESIDSVHNVISTSNLNRRPFPIADFAPRGEAGSGLLRGLASRRIS